jgi:hypothetical protein
MIMKRLYLIGMIMIILAANIPDVSTLLQSRMIQMRPYITVAKDSLSNALIPIVGAIQKSTVDTTASYSLTHGQSLTAIQIDAILKDIQSPAMNTGSLWISLGEEKTIDAAYLLAIFMHESGAATNQGWIGIKAIGHTYNIGNTICAGYDPNRDGILNCYKGFRDYSDYPTERERWYTALEDNYNNLAFYRDKREVKDFDAALRIWAPPEDNNTEGYIRVVHELIDGWRAINDAARNAKAVSAPITINSNDPFGYNVKSALDMQKGALRHVVIESGDTWSFNEALGKPKYFPALKSVAGIEGGGWCDLACRYIQVAKGLGLHTVYLQHGGIALNSCSVEDSPYIWTVDGIRGLEKGRQDLLITNNTVYTAMIEVIEKDNAAIIIGNLE